jgi:Peptidase family M23
MQRATALLLAGSLCAAHWISTAVAAAPSSPAPAAEPIEVTPLVIGIAHRPQPFKGSDGHYHLTYEMNLESFTGVPTRLDGLDVISGQTGASVQHLDAQGLAPRLVVRDHQAVPGVFGPSQLGILYLHVVLAAEKNIPRILIHRVSMNSAGQDSVATAAPTRVAPLATLVLDAPLRGARFIAGDACCDSTRHVRATLPLNGQAFDAQRFAIDWEQLDGEDRLYSGDPKDPRSYVIYGKPAYAVADARVVVAEDDMEDSPIGALPNLSVDKADGNHVVLDLGHARYALYAHFKPHSVRVRAGQQVKRGEVLGLVGTSGNSSEPHLHFHVADGPSLAANGIPYVLREFTATRRARSTAAFDQAIIDGAPIPTEPLGQSGQHSLEYPLDLTIADLPGATH